MSKSKNLYREGDIVENKQLINGIVKDLEADGKYSVILTTGKEIKIKEEDLKLIKRTAK